jgi:hypothetical protein
MGGGGEGKRTNSMINLKTKLKGNNIEPAK